MDDFDFAIPGGMTEGDAAFKPDFGLDRPITRPGTGFPSPVSRVNFYHKNRPQATVGKPSQVKLKVHCPTASQTLTLVVPRNISYERLKDRIDAKLQRSSNLSLSDQVPLERQVKIRCIDKDGDLVSIQNDEDLELSFDLNISMDQIEPRTEPYRAIPELEFELSPGSASPISPPTSTLPKTPDDDDDQDCLEVSELSPDMASMDHAQSFNVRQAGTIAFAHFVHQSPMHWMAEDALLSEHSEGQPQRSGLATGASTNVNFSKKRPAPEDYQLENRSLKSMRTLDDPNLGWKVEEEESELVYGLPHFELDRGLKNEFICSCGRKYTRHFRLNQHIEVMSGNSKHPCIFCGKVFGRLDSLHRHEDNTHGGGKVDCPGCKKQFRMDYLPKHLATAKWESCKVVAEAVYLEANNELGLDIQPAVEKYWIPLIANPWRRAGAGAIRREAFKNDGREESVVDNVSLGSQTMPRRTHEPCDLCGVPFGPTEKELLDHIETHSLDFSAKKYNCDECQINFAYVSDLHMHSQAASKGHCGFKFHHGGNRNKRSCTGHHPPPVDKLFYDDHRDMEATLWLWENCQLRAHRATMARLLAERLAYSQPPRLSLPDEEIDCMAVLSRLSGVSFDSFHSIPAWIRYQDRMSMERLSADLNSVALEPVEPGGSGDSTQSARTRPDSGLAKPSAVNFSMLRLEPNRPKPASRASSPEEPTTSESAESMFDLTSYRNTYAEQLKAARGPGGLKSKASSVRYRARVATLSLLPANRLVKEIECVQYAGSGMA